MIARAPTSAYALAFPCPSRREPGVPWSKKTGNPSGSPHSAIVSVRPSTAATVCVPDAPAMTASSSTGLHGDKLALVRGTFLNTGPCELLRLDAQNHRPSD